MPDSERRVEIMARFSFPAEGDVPSYTDALYFSAEDYDALAPGELARMERERYDAFVTAIRTPPPPPAPTEPVSNEDLVVAAQAALEAAQAVLDAAQAGTDTPPEG